MAETEQQRMNRIAAEQNERIARAKIVAGERAHKKRLAEQNDK